MCYPFNNPSVLLYYAFMAVHKWSWFEEKRRKHTHLQRENQIFWNSWPIGIIEFEAAGMLASIWKLSLTLPDQSLPLWHGKNRPVYVSWRRVTKWSPLFLDLPSLASSWPSRCLTTWSVSSTSSWVVSYSGLTCMAPAKIIWHTYTHALIDEVHTLTDRKTLFTKHNDAQKCRHCI